MRGNITITNRTLLADGVAFIGMQLRDVLTKRDPEIVGEAENGLDAIKRYQESLPDLITMDITMPEMDGIEVVTKIRKLVRL